MSKTTQFRPWRFIVLCRDEYDDDDYSHAFETAGAARDYVEKLHERLWDEKGNKFKSGKGFEFAELFRITSTGKLSFLDGYETTADDDGDARGWFQQ